MAMATNWLILKLNMQQLKKKGILVHYGLVFVLSSFASVK